MSHWTKKREAAANMFFLRLTFVLYRFFSLTHIGFILHPLTFFYYVFSPRQRRFSRDFFTHIDTFTHNSPKKIFRTYRHFYSFSLSLIEKIAAWNNDLSVHNVLHEDNVVYDEVIALLRQKKGLVLLGSHLGNIELLRALAVGNSHEVPLCINIILNAAMTARFNTLLALIQKKWSVNIFDSNAITVDTICILQEKLAQGEIVVIAGDRTAGENQKRQFQFSFLGEPAFFPYGSFLLPVLLKFPVYYFFALRKGDALKTSYVFSLMHSRVDFLKMEKSAAIRFLAAEFVENLEKKTAQFPFQWYNFYNFWST